jgi:flagellin-like protein
MNVFGREVRSWRKTGRRGVSPIIATILLVAITVVLAAVLYVLISGLTSTGASTPFTLGMSAPSETTSGTVFWGTITISPSGGLTTGIFGLALKSSTGTAIAVGVAPSTTCKAGATFSVANCGVPTSGTWYVALVFLANNTVANVYASGGWGSTVSVTAALSLVVVAAVSSGLSGSSDTLNAFPTGSSSVSGTSGAF